MYFNCFWRFHKTSANKKITKKSTTTAFATMTCSVANQLPTSAVGVITRDVRPWLLLCNSAASILITRLRHRCRHAPSAATTNVRQDERGLPPEVVFSAPPQQHRSMGIGKGFNSQPSNQRNKKNLNQNGYGLVNTHVNPKTIKKHWFQTWNVEDETLTKNSLLTSDVN